VIGPRAEYDRRVGAGDIELDPAQEQAVDELDRLHRELVAASRESRTLAGRLRKLARRPSPVIRGIYLVGEVGRGKTLLMDLFFHCLPFPEKKRRDFHRFMAGVHERLRALRDEENPLETVAGQIASECRVICFDEFAVGDIADAMILGNLFTALFARGVTLTATSNVEPQNLYKDGLQRQRFLGAIEAIEAHTLLIRVDGPEDYRLRALEAAPVYLCPPGPEAEARLATAFAAIAPDDSETDGTLEILGRPIAFRQCSDGIVWFEFAAICEGPRSQEDYIELAREYQTVLISNVPQLDSMRENEARRLIALVDEFYDRRVKLIVSAQVDLDSLYTGRRLELEFERTRSRLVEMQSHEYLGTAHRP